MSPALRVFVIIAGIAAIAGGIVQMNRGVKEMSGTDPEISRLAEESNKAVNEANKHGLEANPVFESLWVSIEKDGLAAARAQKADDAEKAAHLFGKAAEHFRLAAQRLEEAAARKPGEKMTAYFETKSRSYKAYAAAREINETIARMALDESIKSIGELEPKVQEAARERDELEASGAEAAAAAGKIAGEMKK